MSIHVELPPGTTRVDVIIVYRASQFGSDIALTGADLCVSSSPTVPSSPPRRRPMTDVGVLITLDDETRQATT